MRNGSRTLSEGKTEFYLVKWKGDTEATWEPEDNLACAALLEEYEKRKTQRRRLEAMRFWRIGVDTMTRSKKCLIDPTLTTSFFLLALFSTLHSLFLCTRLQLAFVSASLGSSCLITRLRTYLLVTPPPGHFHLLSYWQTRRREIPGYRLAAASTSDGKGVEKMSIRTKTVRAGAFSIMVS
jgi:hypothetical protein